MSRSLTPDQKLLPNIKIKQEKITPPPSPQKPSSTIVPNVETDLRSDATNIKIKQEDDVKKPVEVLKSSSELIAELFKVFNAAPPDSLDELDYKPKKSKKKHKKHKKKHKKKGRSSSDSEQSGSDNEKKFKKSKKHKKSKSKQKSSKPETVVDEKCLKEKEVKKENNVDIKHVPRKHHKRIRIDDEPIKEREKEKEKEKEKGFNIEEYENQLLTETRDQKSHSKVDDNPLAKKRKIVIKNLKNSSVYAEAMEQIKSKEKRIEDGEVSESGSSRSSSISLSDEETYLRDRERYYRGSSSYYGHSTSSYRDNRYDDRYVRDRRRYKKRDDDDHRYDRKKSDRSRRRSRSRSRRRDNSVDKIDKKRLLEIARKNAIQMFKSGMLPGVQNMAPEAKEKILTKMRYGGKTVNELTEFCKKLSNGESSGYLSNVSADSDHDQDGNDKAFNHPFVLKDRGPIVMNIKNATPIPPKNAEQTKAILLQFPVSSGQHHRQNENEWIPVVAQKKKSPPLAIAAPPAPVVKPMVIAKEKLVELLPAPPPTEAPETPVNNIFEPITSKQDLDVTSIITNRLNAMRKLQDNPLDHEALKILYNTQKDMSAWANSKFVPGQFTGSTGANVLTPRELQSGFQAWAKRDQMISTTPVAGGMGMHILQKMGWKPGEGLGKEKNGSLQPLLLEVKLDKKGLLANEEDPHAPKRRRPANVAQAKQTLENKHPVSLLGELAAKRKWLPPMYETVMEAGPHHSRQFFFKVSINGSVYQPQTPCNNKKEAKAMAARFALQQMGMVL